MYHVIVVLDEKRNKSYYYSYVDKDGNIECAELPPYQDINKARACYWDGKKWIYDADKHEEIVTIQAAEKEAVKKRAAEAEAIPTNAELALAVMDVGDGLSAVVDAIAELRNEVAMLKGGE